MSWETGLLPSFCYRQPQCIWIAKLNPFMLVSLLLKWGCDAVLACFIGFLRQRGLWSMLLTLNRWFCRTGNDYYADVSSTVILVFFIG